jgi:hypothetical protein
MNNLPKEIHLCILDFCDLRKDYFNVMHIDKYWCQLVIKDELFMGWQIFCVECDKYLMAKALTNACMYGNLKVCQYLFYTCSDESLQLSRYAYYDKSNVPNLGHKMFKNACYYGYIDVAKWIIGLKNNPKIGKIDIHFEDEYCFYNSCINGHIKIAKYLIELGNDPYYGKVNIHIKNEHAFVFACIYNHLDVVKWLVELSNNPEYGKIDIHYASDYAFTRSHDTKQFDVCKYLIELGKSPGFTPIDQCIIDRYPIP